MASSDKKIILVKRLTNAAMTVLLVCLSAYQVTGQEAHEHLGVVMVVLIVAHNWMDRRWYGALLKGRYALSRAARTAVNVALAICIAALAWSGAAMSGYALTFLNMSGMTAAARAVHLAASYWAFALIGIHIGMHARIKSRAVVASALAAAALGAYVFISSEIPSYMTLASQFVYFDYDEPALSVFAQNISMLVAWAVLGWIINMLSSIRKGQR